MGETVYAVSTPICSVSLAWHVTWSLPADVTECYLSCIRRRRWLLLFGFIPIGMQHIHDPRATIASE
jgi:hypothetical protein